MKDLMSSLIGGALLFYVVYNLAIFIFGILMFLAAGLYIKLLFF